MIQRNLLAIGMIASFPLAGMIVPAQAGGRTLILRASWYGKQSNGTRMADGEVFQASDPTIAAHKTLPFGTVLRVTNPENGKSIHVVVKDRGPYIAGRSLDLSHAAAAKLGFVEKGVTRLEVQIVRYGG